MRDLHQFILPVGLNWFARHEVNRSCECVLPRLKRDAQVVVPKRGRGQSPAQAWGTSSNPSSSPVCYCDLTTFIPGCEQSLMMSFA
jgi:hypothetical protein